MAPARSKLKWSVSVHETRGFQGTGRRAEDGRGVVSGGKTGEDEFVEMR